MSASSRRYVILTPFKKADVLAGICKLHGLDVWVVPSKQGAMVVHDLPVPVFDDWDISELLGADTSEQAPGETTESSPLSEATQSIGGDQTDQEVPQTPGAEQAGNAEQADRSDTLQADNKEAVAQRLAKLSRAGVLLLTSELGEDVGNEEGVSGLVTALAYDSAGTATETPAGLIVATGEAILEDLLIGTTKPEDVKGAIRSGSIESKIIEKLADGQTDAGSALPPRRPRRFFGKDNT